MKNIENTFYIKSNLGKKILLSVLAVFLMLGAGFFVFSSVEKTAKAESTWGSNCVYCYAEKDFSVDVFVPARLYDLVDSSKVCSMRVYVDISAKAYGFLCDSNTIAFGWGRKAEMDFLANYVCSGSTAGDPGFHWDTDNDSGEDNVLLLTGLIDRAYNEGVHDRAYHLFEPDKFSAHATFPYTGVELKQSDFWQVNENCYRCYVPIEFSFGNLFDFGILLCDQFNNGIWTDTYFTAYYSCDSIVSIAQDFVQHAASNRSDAVIPFEKALGIYREGNTEIEYSYLKMADGDHFNKIETVTDSISVPSYLVPDTDWVRSQIYNVMGSSGLSGFNVDYVPTVNGVMENGQFVEREVFGRRTVRQATGFNYAYSFSNGSGGYSGIPERVRGSEIAYNPYTYSGFWVRIANIGDLNQVPENYFENNLYIDVFHTSYQEKNGRMYLYYDYQTIIQMFERTLHWAVKDNSFRLDVRGNYNSSAVTVEELKDENNKATGFAVSFPYSSASDKASQPCLQGLEITGLASITVPVEVDCTVEYKILHDDLTESTSNFNLDHKYWTAGDSSKITITDLVDELLSENGSWSNLIYGSIRPAVLGGIEYMRPVRVDYDIDFENGTAVLVVKYSYNSSVLMVTNDLNSDVWAFNLPSSVAIYSLRELEAKARIPVGWRIGRIDSTDGFYFQNKDLGNPLNSTFYKDGSTRDVPYTMTVHLTDKWPVNITYYERFKESPFFVKTVVEKQLRVADFDDIFALTSDDVKIVLGKETLNLFELSMVENVNVDYDSEADKYFVTLDYSVASLKGKDYNGNDDEVKVPLTCYADWTESFGKYWTVMMLNDSENHYFKNTDGIRPTDLYGFFSVAVFKERVSDLNYWFQSYSAKGCKTTFVSKETKGSEIYKFFDNWGNPLNKPFMAFCELFNKDDAMYYSYFFYLDGSTDLAFLAINGADDYSDNDSALKNKAQDIGEAVGDFFSSIWDKVKNSKVVKVITIVGAVILGVIVLSLVIKLIMIIFRKK